MRMRFTMRCGGFPPASSVCRTATCTAPTRWWRWRTWNAPRAYAPPSRGGSRRRRISFLGSRTVQADPQPAWRRDGVFDDHAQAPHRHGLEAIELPMSDRRAAGELSPRAVHGPVHGISRDALALSDVFLQ